MNPLTPVIALTLLIATVKTATDFPAYIAAKQWSAVFKQLIAWCAGVGGALVLAASDFGSSIQATETLTLASANHWTVALFGLALGSGASVTHQLIQAVDGTQSAYVPPLVNQPKTLGSSAPADAAPNPSAANLGINIPIPS